MNLLTPTMCPQFTDSNNLIIISFFSKNFDSVQDYFTIQLLFFSVQDQSSDPITLKGGHTYFMEALSYHDTEDAPMKIGVRLPSGKILAPIPSQYLKLERGGTIFSLFKP